MGKATIHPFYEMNNIFWYEGAAFLPAGLPHAGGYPADFPAPPG